MEAYAIGPRASPAVDGDRVYVEGTMGRLLCLNVATGAVIWEKDFIKDFGLRIPYWGMTSPPVVDGTRSIQVRRIPGTRLHSCFGRSARSIP